MSAILRSIGDGWTFAWKQPALLRAGVWLILLPMAVSRVLDVPLPTDRPEYAAVVVVVQLGIAVLLTWGTACVLTIGRRLLQAKSGRMRTSFTAVRTQARGIIVSLLLTDILRGCIALFLGLPLVVFLLLTETVAHERNATVLGLIEQYPWLPLCMIPFTLLPILYLIQTSLAAMVVAYEKTAFRPALARSRALIRGHLWYMVGVLVVIGLLWVPGIVLDAVITSSSLPYAVTVSAVLTATLNTIALVLSLLSLTLHYKKLGGGAKPLPSA